MPKELGFELLGFCNAGGDDMYPHIVVPIGRLNGLLVACYVTMKNYTHVTDPIYEGSDYVRLTESMKQSLAGFDWTHDNLFAMSPEDVVKFHDNDLIDFFRGKLADENFARGKPFIRLSMATATLNPNIIRPEIVRCYQKLSMVPEFQPSWLAEQIRHLQESGVELGSLSLT